MQMSAEMYSTGEKTASTDEKETQLAKKY